MRVINQLYRTCYNHIPRVWLMRLHLSWHHNVTILLYNNIRSTVKYILGVMYITCTLFSRDDFPTCIVILLCFICMHNVTYYYARCFCRCTCTTRERRCFMLTPGVYLSYTGEIIFTNHNANVYTRKIRRTLLQGKVNPFFIICDLYV